MSWRPDTPLTPLKMSINQGNSDLKILLKKLEGKAVYILTKFNIRYRTNCLIVGEDSIQFLDKWGTEVFLSIDQIAQIVEVKENGS